jgi:hypothetical protein
MTKWKSAVRIGAACFLFAATAGAQLASAADEMCGEPGGTPEEVQARISKAENVKEIFRDQSFVAYQNQKDFTTWTFALPTNPAQPAVVCRKPVRDGDKMVLQMDIVCKGPDIYCKKLKKDFEELNARMQMEIESKQK